MQFKKLALTLTLSAAFGLMACGDDSSSGSNSGSAKEELAALEAEFAQLQKEAKEAHEKLGECSEENQNVKKTVTLLGIDYTVVCEEDDDGEWEWESDELDNLFDEYEEKIEEAQKKVNEEEKKDPKDDPDSPITGKGCNFKIEDEVWSFDIVVTLDGGITSATRQSLEIKGSDRIETIISEISGGNASAACAYLPEDAKHSEEENGDITTTEDISCDGGKMITTNVRTQKGAITEYFTKEDAFDSFMDRCKRENGIEDEEDDEEENGKKSEEEEGETKDYGVTCNFTADDDVWNIEVTNKEGYKIITYTFNDDECTQSQEVGIDYNSTESCEYMASMGAGECKGTVFIASTNLGNVPFTSKQELYNEVQETYCK